MSLIEGMPQDASSLVGQVVGGMDVVSKLGQGGMGEVYLARERATGGLRAIKIIRDDWQGDGSSVKRFAREASVLRRLDHAAIVRLHEFGELASGWPYLAMEYVEGVDLQTLVSQQGPMALGPGLRVLARIASALEYAHREGIVHRDLKPGNVVLRGGDPAAATLIDFGLVKVVSDGFLTKLTADREVLGSPHFMAPEQARGERDLGAPVDVYALAGVAYVVLSGKPPFGELPLLQLVTAHLRETPPRLSTRLPSVPPLLDNLLFACLAKKAGDRPHTDELAAHLDSLAARAPVAAPAAAVPRADALAITQADGNESVTELASRIWSVAGLVRGDSLQAALFNQTCAVVLELGGAMASARPALVELGALVAGIRARQDEMTHAEMDLAIEQSERGSSGSALEQRVRALGDAQAAAYRELFARVAGARDQVTAPELDGLYRELERLVERMRLGGF